MKFLVSALVVLASVLFVAKRASRDSPAESPKGELLKGLDAPLKEVASEELAALPSPVWKWMEWSGVAGREEIRSVYAKQIGRMKLKPEQEKWMASEARQYTTAEPFGFIWKVKMKMGNGLFVTGKDEFREGKADMRIKMGDSSLLGKPATIRRLTSRRCSGI